MTTQALMNRLSLGHAERNILSGILGCEPDQVSGRLQQGAAAGVGAEASRGGVAQVGMQVHQVRDQGFVGCVFVHGGPCSMKDWECLYLQSWPDPVGVVREDRYGETSCR